MRRGLFSLLLTALALAAVHPAGANEGMPREDLIWARVSPTAITLDGVLNEPGWAKAESTIVRFGIGSGIPGSGWKIEGTSIAPSAFDSTYAVLKLLSRDNQIYLGVRVRDKSVGGSAEFNRMDGLLMAVKDHLSDGIPKPPAEYFYGWWYPYLTDPQPEGQLPRFIGKFGEVVEGEPRTPEAIAAWDAVTIVHGLSNSDAVPDQGYTVEMRFDCAAVGYDITQPQGDTFEWNISVYDCDGWWPYNVAAFSSTRTWLQGPWGNAPGYNEMRVMSRPDVTTASGPLPVVLPEIVYPRLTATATIDGYLTDPVWSDPNIYTFDMRYGDAALRDTYPAVGPFRAGQYQPTVNGGEAYVVDPGDATIKMFVAGDKLYVGFDVRDQCVQYHVNPFRWDGFYVHVTEIDSLDLVDHTLRGERLGFQVSPTGTALASGYLANLVSRGLAQIALHTKPGTTVDTLGITPDTGYTAELAVDLTDFGYTPGDVHGPLFLGVVMLDGDSYLPIEDSYGTKTWWFREYDNTCCPPWGYVSSTTTGVGPGSGGDSGGGFYGSAQSYPNPSLEPQIRYSLPELNRVTLEVYDMRGRLVERRPLGEQGAGERTAALFGARRPGAGVYLYRLRLEDPQTGQLRSVLTGKTIVLD
ncbi:MAG: T9SS type A sorting domain-containing protein [Candidatus Krumholzibacteriia bacterium]